MAATGAPGGATEKLLRDPSVKRMMEGRPHVYPPSANPPFVWRNGAIVARRTDASNMTNEIWATNNCQTVHWCTIIVESTPGGARKLRTDGLPTTLSMSFGNEGIWEHCFGNCMICWKSQTRQFSDSNRTANPYKVDLTDPSLPQLGACGCVICTGCILQHFEVSEVSKFLRCPYCAQNDSFHLEIKVWILSDRVFGKGMT